ncbi:IscA/HesB family protein [Pseudodesulfovibrio sp. zrk46]|uniref:IscA/HesB family protein n=1 Tax=Pseudodesulfovibrio sp. zrk46 TaxID=2725288 RepID=UPI001448F97C|nr:IscA/HesB family protein [Pseudodesulfovibrio sp. zrk46]QJB55456.1 heme biosynthesis protein HemY [Pseudodesulfovibrio sp. zrk46]
MISVTPPAAQAFSDYFKDKTASPIRIHLIDGGCSGMRLSLALDEKRDDDHAIDQEGFQFLVNKELAEATGKLSIDMSEYGFTINSENPVGGGGCASGSCGSAGGCSSSGCGC